MTGAHTSGPFHVESGEPLLAFSDDGGPAGWFVCHPKTECNSTALCFVVNEADANRIAAALNLYGDLLSVSPAEQIGHLINKLHELAPAAGVCVDITVRPTPLPSGSIER